MTNEFNAVRTYVQNTKRPLQAAKPCTRCEKTNNSKRHSVMTSNSFCVTFVMEILKYQVFRFIVFYSLLPPVVLQYKCKYFDKYIHFASAKQFKLYKYVLVYYIGYIIIIYKSHIFVYSVNFRGGNPYFLIFTYVYV